MFFLVVQLFYVGLPLGKPQKKIPPVMAGPLKRGGGVKGRAIKEKITFFETFVAI